MAVLEIAKLPASMQGIANDVDASGTKDGKIDKTELINFQTKADELKSQGKITDDDYKAVFGLEIAQKEEVNVDSLAYVDVKAELDKKREVQAEIDSINNEIARLSSDIELIKTKLYGNRKDLLNPTGKITKSQESCIAAIATLSALFGCFALGTYHENFPFLARKSPLLAGGLGFLVTGTVVALGAFALTKQANKSRAVQDMNYIQQRQQSNEELYKALNYAQEQKAKLESQKANLEKEVNNFRIENNNSTKNNTGNNGTV